LRPQVGEVRYHPFAFTEQVVAILTSVLNSPKAIQINIQIMCAFILLRQYALGSAELNKKPEICMPETNIQFTDIFQALTELFRKSNWKKNPGIRLGMRRNKKVV